MPTPLSDLDAAIVAASNNADRVDEVARRAGVATRRDDRRWWALSRTPPFHPDAVTLAPGLRGAETLDGTEAGPTWSVKDSFADLDLTDHGFAVLIEGSWMWHDPPAVAPGPLGWTWSTDADRHVVEVDGRTVASCTLTCSATVVGVTNVAADEDPVAVWAEVLTLAARTAPATPVVAWDPDDDVPAARVAGFRVVGPMRVWTHA